MAIEIQKKTGNYYISRDAISVAAGISAMEVFGLVGMASRKQFKDGIAELLGMDNLNRGVEVILDGDEITIDIYIIVSYGTKISEVAHNVQQQVIYSLKSIIGIDVTTVNVIVQGVRVTQA